MNNTRTVRHAPMTFINRGGKHASGTIAEAENSDRIATDSSSTRSKGERAYGIGNPEPDRAKSSRTMIGPAGRHEKSPATRSSRV